MRLDALARLAAWTRSSGWPSVAGMAHVVEAFVVRSGALAAGALGPARVIALRQGVSLVPVTRAVLAHAAAAFPAAAGAAARPADAAGAPPVLFADLPKLDAAALAWMHSLAGATAPFAYLETDYDGGRARQAAAVWRGGALVYGPRRGNIGPINEALAHLGVHGVGTSDAFDAVGLGRHRTTEEWFAAR